MGVSVECLQSTYNESFTWFTSNAAATCPAPTLPIWFQPRSSVVSAYDPCHRENRANYGKTCPHLVHLQRNSQMISAHVADSIVRKMQCSERLY